ncbi:hypothetical protein Ahy_B01g052187 [Arachis hypogaea]|uniref:Transposase MuDR plant domain-containing protein n=1 Tax=Arachis hypogaea TaxID=3818 RepID=A0A445ANR5_ARAHY|nr:hypothetical protein Ahy_B01g052187 [Arachis hypogaea]
MYLCVVVYNSLEPTTKLQTNPPPKPIPKSQPKPPSKPIPKASPNLSPKPKTKSAPKPPFKSTPKLPSTSSKPTSSKSIPTVTRPSARLVGKVVKKQDNGVKDSSDSHDSYESAEDILYRPEPQDSSTDSNSNIGLSRARLRELKLKHVSGSAWKKGKEKILLEENGIVVENSVEEELKTLPTSDEEWSEDETDDVFPIFSNGGWFGELKFQVGMKFNTKQEFIDTVREFTSQEGREIKFKKNESYKVRAICKWTTGEDEDFVRCPWIAYAFRNHEETCW